MCVSQWGKYNEKKPKGTHYFMLLSRAYMSPIQKVQQTSDICRIKFHDMVQHNRYRPQEMVLSFYYGERKKEKYSSLM